MYSMQYALLAAAAVALPLTAAAQSPSGATISNRAQVGASAQLTPVERGDVFMARKMYRAAIDQYQKAAQTPEILNKTGIAYHHLEQLDLAKKYYERALKAQPNFPEALNNLGTVYYEKRNYGKAISQYRKAIKLDAGSAVYHKGLGTAYWQDKKYKAAIQAYTEAIKLDPAVFDPSKTNGVGTTLEDQSYGERAKLHYFLAKTFAESGMNDKALLYIRKSLEEGFKDRKKYLEEPEFAKVRETKEFQEMMAAEPHAL